MNSNISSNYDISNWDVSSVTDMSSMFRYSLFNGDISGWDVSSVTNMDYMFKESQFNQDLYSWSVTNVTQCGNFSEANTVWTLPKPNFTNCDPN